VQIGIITLVIVVALLAPALYFFRSAQVQRRSRERLEEALQSPPREGEPAPPAASRIPPVLPRYRAVPWLIAAFVFLFCLIGFGLNLLFSVVFAAIALLLTSQLEHIYHERRILWFEMQLADAIDLLVSSLNAGAGVTRALEFAAEESGSPLKQQLEHITARIRYGDDPQSVFRAFMRRVPLENVRLFSTALSVHWEVGGSLGPTLAMIGRSVRDRIEITRRIRTMTAQTRISTIAVIIATYFIALIMWRNAPDRFEAFLSTPVGQALVAGAIFLQAVGIAWSAALSRPRY